jgi:hypothetical protein
MRELVRTNDAVLVSAVGALLDGAGIPYFVLDQNMSVLEGSLGILPRRVSVAEEHARAARRLLKDAGLGHELRPDAAEHPAGEVTEGVAPRSSLSLACGLLIDTVTRGWREAKLFAHLTCRAPGKGRRRGRTE